MSWDSIAGSRVAAALPRDEFVNFGIVAQNARAADQLSEKEADDWAQIYRVVGPARRTDAAEVNDIRAAIARAEFALNLNRLLAPQVEKIVLDRKLLTPADLNVVESEMRSMLKGRNYRATCGPIGDIPSKRVTAPFDPAVQRDPLAGIYDIEPGGK